MKKLFAILLAVAMILAMATTAFAAEEETVELTIAGILGHTYNVYQIYTGDVADEDGTLVLSNVKYGQNHYPVDGNVGDAVPDTDLQDFINSADPSNYFRAQITGAPYAVVNADGSLSSQTIDVAPGYYLIVDVTTDLPDGQTKSPVILKVAEATTIASKHASISSSKKVKDVNDSVANSTSDWQNSADYDIGDKVPFQLTVTLPDTLSLYDSYELTFHDKQAAGFNAPEDFVVSIVDAAGVVKVQVPVATEGTNGYTVAACASEKCEYGGCSFTVKVGDIVALYGVNEFAEGDMIVVTYNSVLNDAANVGRIGNENSMYVCHPDGHTPESKVTVLTYELKLNKIDGTTKEALEGAGFTLYKQNAEGVWEKLGDEITGVTSFTWSGLDDGNYRLEETTTPAGYNTMAPVEFMIDATHKTAWLADGSYALDSVSAKNLAGTATLYLDVDANGQLDGKLEGNIENYKGTVLPETGAEGTFLLITCGALLVVVASVFMITRKKMSIFED